MTQASWISLGVLFLGGFVACGGSSSSDSPSATGGQGGTPAATGGTGTTGGISTGGTGTGGTSTGGTAAKPFKSGLPGATVVSALTPAQVTTLCKGVTGYVETGSGMPLDSALCMAPALTAALSVPAGTSLTATRAACSATYDGCTATLGDATTACQGATTNCGASVTELETCLTAMTGAFGTLKSLAPSCATFDPAAPGMLAGLMLAQGTTFLPCGPITEKCPALLGPAAATGGAGGAGGAGTLP